VLGDTLQAHKYSGFITGLSQNQDYGDTAQFLKTHAEAYEE
jgi:hypothetical protein